MKKSIGSDMQSHVTLKPTKLKLDLEPLTYDRYWRFGVLPAQKDYSFCKNMGSAPLITSEFRAAKESYPIVFFDVDGATVPHAILGLTPSINSALTHKHDWRTRLYIPQAFSFYPFGMVNPKNLPKDFTDSLSTLGAQEEDNEPKEDILGIVPRNSMLVPLQDNPRAHQLFQQDGSITPFISNLLTMQSNFLQRGSATTEAFVSALKSNDLLVKRNIRLHFKDGGKLTLDGFSTISQSALSRLTPAMHERWDTLGYIDYIEQHLESLNRWSRLIILHERRLNRALRNLRKT